MAPIFKIDGVVVTAAEKLEWHRHFAATLREYRRRGILKAENLER